MSELRENAANRPDLPRLLVLGPVVVQTADGEQRVAGARSRDLLVALALEPGRAVAATTLSDLLWSDDEIDDPRAALQSVVSRARRDAGAELIESVPGGYRWRGDSDLAEVERLLGTAESQARACDWAAAAESARAALAAWRAEPAMDLAADSSVSGRLSMRASALRARLRHLLADALLKRGEAAAAIELGRGAVEADPLDEQAVLDLIRALQADGQVTEALRVFGALRERLADELGIDPSPEALAVHQALLTAGPPTAADQAEHARDARHRIGLRVTPTSLIGRSDDIVEVETALRSSQLVTILGPGGLGKTRLAVEVARRAADRGSGVMVAELTAASTANDVDLALAAALGLRDPSAPGRPGDPGGHRALRDRVIEQLDRGAALLVIDNCEHVIDAAAALATDVLSRASVRILATSRAPLAVAGEQVYAPRALSAGVDGTAAELFCERARAVRPDAELPLDVVARLCERLDGLPLAIELAAARIRSMSVAEIERRLESRFALLTRGDRSAPERHRTLQAVLEWSWNLLSGSEQRLLRRASILAGGFDLTAAAAVGGGGETVLDDVDGLVRQSLLVVDDAGGEGRYRMLETVREFGLMQLDAAGERNRAHRAAQDWARALSADLRAQLIGPAQVTALQRIAVERENLVQLLRGAVTDGRGGVAAEIAAVLAMSATMQGAHEEVGAIGTEALPLLRRSRVPLEHRDAAVHGLLFMGITLALMNPAAGRRALATLRDYARKPAGLSDRMRALVAWSRVRSLGEFVQLAPAFIEHEDAYVGFLAAMAGAAYAENAGQLGEAESFAAAAHRRATKLDSTWEMAVAAMFLAQVFNESGQPARVGEWAKRARDGLSRLGARGDVIQVLLMEVGSTLTLGDAEGARHLLGEVEALTADQQRFTSAFSAEELRVALSAARAELAWLDGDAEAAVAAYRASDQPSGRVSPALTSWALLHGAAELAFLVLSRVAPADEVATRAGRLRRRFRALWKATAPGPMVDAPLLGSVCLALGAYLWSTPELDRVDDGLELLAWADRLGSRQDLPSLSRPRQLVAARERVGAERLDAAIRQVDASTEPAVERVVAIIDRPGWG